MPRQSCSRSLSVCVSVSCPPSSLLLDCLVCASSDFHLPFIHLIHLILLSGSLVSVAFLLLSLSSCCFRPVSRRQSDRVSERPCICCSASVAFSPSRSFAFPLACLLGRSLAQTFGFSRSLSLSTSLFHADAVGLILIVGCTTVHSKNSTWLLS